MREHDKRERANPDTPVRARATKSLRRCASEHEHHQQQHQDQQQQQEQQQQQQHPARQQSEAATARLPSQPERVASVEDLAEDMLGEGGYEEDGNAGGTAVAAPPESYLDSENLDLRDSPVLAWAANTHPNIYGDEDAHERGKSTYRPRSEDELQAMELALLLADTQDQLQQAKETIGVQREEFDAMGGRIQTLERFVAELQGVVLRARAIDPDGADASASSDSEGPGGDGAAAHGADSGASPGASPDADSDANSDSDQSHRGVEVAEVASEVGGAREYLVVSDSDSDSLYSQNANNSAMQLASPTFPQKHVTCAKPSKTIQWDGKKGQPAAMLRENLSLWAMPGFDADFADVFDLRFRHSGVSLCPIEGTDLERMHPIMNKSKDVYTNERLMLTFQTQRMLQRVADCPGNDAKGKSLLAFGLPDNLEGAFEGVSGGEFKVRLESIMEFVVARILPAYGLSAGEVSLVFSIISSMKCAPQLFHTDGSACSAMAFINVLMNVCAKEQGLDVEVDGVVHRVMLRPGQMIVFRGDHVHRGLGLRGIRLHVCILPRRYRFYAIDKEHAEEQLKAPDANDPKQFKEAKLTDEVTELLLR